MEQPAFTTPILLVVFNRPDTTRRVFAEIRKQRPASLFIAADGPRPERPSDVEKCREVREIVSQIDWPCDVKTLFRDTNLGFAEGERTAFEWFFGQVEEGIVLEDDGLPHPDFFKFCAEMLERYRDDDRVMMITGDNFLPDFPITDSYFFSRFFPIWGWASWRRVWDKYDVTLKDWEKKESKQKLEGLYRQKFMWRHMRKMFDDVYTGKYITWDAQLAYACIMNDGLCVVPRFNLISNIGIEGTHSQGHNQNLSTQGLYNESGLQHPVSFEPLTAYDELFYERSFKPPPFSLKRAIISVLVRYEFIKKIYRLVRPKNATLN